MTKNAKVLNMEEKKTFEKIIHADIARAVQVMKSKRAEELEKLEKEYANSTKAQNLFTMYQHAEKALEIVKKEMREAFLDTHTAYSSKKVTLRVDTDWPKGDAFRDGIRDTANKMEDMKRTYTLKLFAGGEEIERLFTELAKTLKELSE